jgi:acetyl-CoA carboxylase carboxyltransferase component
VSALDTRAFALWARLSGIVPRIAVVAGRCFAGNAVIAGAADLIVAAESTSLGMGGPVMVEGGGLGRFEPEQIGPIEVQSANGVVDVRVEDELQATTVTRDLLGYFQGPRPDHAAPNQDALREIIPTRRRRAYDVRKVIDGLCDAGSVAYLRAEFAPEMVTGLARIEGHSIGVIANNPVRLAGAITSAAADKVARFMQLCDAFALPILSLIDTPGMMVGPEAEETGLVRHCSRLFVTAARLRVPFAAVILRKAYGLGAQAMAAGSLHEPLLTVGWPTAELGAMGLEGAVKLGFRRELEAIDDEGERADRLEQLIAAAHEHSKALNAATLFELDDVIDPAETRELVAHTFRAAPRRDWRAEEPRRFVDTW